MILNLFGEAVLNGKKVSVEDVKTSAKATENFEEALEALSVLDREKTETLSGGFEVKAETPKEKIMAIVTINQIVSLIRDFVQTTGALSLSGESEEKVDFSDPERVKVVHLDDEEVFFNFKENSVLYENGGTGETGEVSLGTLQDLYEFITEDLSSPEDLVSWAELRV